MKTSEMLKTDPVGEATYEIAQKVRGYLTGSTADSHSPLEVQVARVARHAFDYVQKITKPGKPLHSKWAGYGRQEARQFYKDGYTRYCDMFMAEFNAMSSDPVIKDLFDSTDQDRDWVLVETAVRRTVVSAQYWVKEGAK